MGVHLIQMVSRGCKYLAEAFCHVCGQFMKTSVSIGDQDKPVVKLKAFKYHQGIFSWLSEAKVKTGDCIKATNQDHQRVQ